METTAYSIQPENLGGVPKRLCESCPKAKSCTVRCKESLEEHSPTFFYQFKKRQAIFRGNGKNYTKLSCEGCFVGKKERPKLVPPSPEPQKHKKLSPILPIELPISKPPDRNLTRAGGKFIDYYLKHRCNKTCFPDLKKRAKEEAVRIDDVTPIENIRKIVNGECVYKYSDVYPRDEKWKSETPKESGGKIPSVYKGNMDEEIILSHRRRLKEDGHGDVNFANSEFEYALRYRGRDKVKSPMTNTPYFLNRNEADVHGAELLELATDTKKDYEAILNAFSVRESPPWRKAVDRAFVIRMCFYPPAPLIGLNTRKPIPEIPGVVGLTKTEKERFYLIIEERLTEEEIAKRWHCDQQAINKSKKKCDEKLKKYISSADYASTPKVELLRMGEAVKVRSCLIITVDEFDAIKKDFTRDIRLRERPLAGWSSIKTGEFKYRGLLNRDEYYSVHGKKIMGIKDIPTKVRYELKFYGKHLDLSGIGKGIGGQKLLTILLARCTFEIEFKGVKKRANPQEYWWIAKNRKG